MHEEGYCGRERGRNDGYDIYCRMMLKCRMRIAEFGIFILLIACSSPNVTSTTQKKSDDFTKFMNAYKQYAYALDLFGSKEPEDWQSARLLIDELKDFPIPNEDRKLIALERGSDAAAAENAREALSRKVSPDLTDAEKSAIWANLNKAVTDYRLYLDALEKFGSSEPTDWQSARDSIALVKSFSIPDNVKQLLEIERGKEISKAKDARAALFKTGRSKKLSLVFLEDRHPEAWEKARAELVSLGDQYAEEGVATLISMLLNPVFLDLSPAIRFNIVEFGAPGFRLSKEAVNLKLDLLPEKPVISQTNELTQLMQVLLSFGSQSESALEEITIHPNHHARRILALAIAESRDPVFLKYVEKLSKDARWEVRMAAYIAFGKTVGQTEKIKLALFEAAKKEQDASCCKEIMNAILIKGFYSFVPSGIEILKFTTNADIGIELLRGMSNITRVRFSSKQDVMKWWEEKGKKEKWEDR